MIVSPRLYNGVRLVNGPAPDNVRRLDQGAMPMVARMMRNGITVDKGALAELSVFLQAEKLRIEDKIQACIGMRVNPGSPPQVAELLFRKLGLGRGKQLKMTNSGAHETTGRLDLEPFVGEHPVVNLIMDWRGCDKLDGTYARPLQVLARQDRYGNWRVHTSILTTRTATGRYASKEPNLQNIPTRTKLGQMVRKCFIAGIAPGGKRGVLISADLSQIEMRVAAHVAQAKRMMRVFFAGGDIHSETAAAAYKLPIEQLHPKKHRYPMKRVGFGVLYLIGPPGLMRQLNSSDAQDPENPHVWTEPECGQLIDMWYQANEEIRDMQEQFFCDIRRYGMSCDMFGRVRLVPEIRSALSWIRDAGLRQGANQPIQGGAGGVLKLGMARAGDDLERFRRARRVWVEELMTIHDELLLESDQDAAQDVGRLVQDALETTVPLTVPVKSSCDIAQSWGEMK